MLTESLWNIHNLWLEYLGPLTSIEQGHANVVAVTFLYNSLDLFFTYFRVQNILQTGEFLHHILKSWREINTVVPGLLMQDNAAVLLTKGRIRDGSKGASAVLVALCIAVPVLAWPGTVLAPQPGMRWHVKPTLAALSLIALHCETCVLPMSGRRSVTVGCPAANSRAVSPRTLCYSAGVRCTNRSERILFTAATN